MCLARAATQTILFPNVLKMPKENTLMVRFFYDFFYSSVRRIRDGLLYINFEVHPIFFVGSIVIETK